MDIDRVQLREWLRTVLLHLGWSGSDLAARIDRVPSTINRFLNDPVASHVLSPKTIKAIENATGFAPFSFPKIELAPKRGFFEADAAHFEFTQNGDDQDLEVCVRAILAAKSTSDPWVLKTRALEYAGFLVGDVLIVNLSEKARPHDLVCAQIYDWDKGRAETVFRIYEPPYLLSASAAAEFVKPYVVDDDSVVIKGVVTHSVRPRRSQLNGQTRK
jgi:hypothetical protein